MRIINNKIIECSILTTLKSKWGILNINIYY